ncbi:hypothetical protein GQ607_003683, partial [Colletotrichum asianum]
KREKKANTSCHQSQSRLTRPAQYRGPHRGHCQKRKSPEARLPPSSHPDSQPTHPPKATNTHPSGRGKKNVCLLSLSLSLAGERSRRGGNRGVQRKRPCRRHQPQSPAKKPACKRRWKSANRENEHTFQALQRSCFPIYT